MTYRLLIWLSAAVCLAGCGALAAEVSTEVAVQVGTAIANLDISETQPTQSSNVVVQSPFDCTGKTCGNMTSCEEAVYNLTMCHNSSLDRNNDGVPCETICTVSQVENITGGETAITASEQDRTVGEEIGPVTRVVDGDTIYVELDGKNVRIRYLQINTPERSDPCFSEATRANAELVSGKTVRLVPDKELVDRYDRLLRFIYVDDVLVNRVLVEQGFAEVVLYPPNDKHYEEFTRLEAEAAADGRGCHPTGIFDDGSITR